MQQTREGGVDIMFTDEEILEGYLEEIVEKEKMIYPKDRDEDYDDDLR